MFPFLNVLYGYFGKDAVIAAIKFLTSTGWKIYQSILKKKQEEAKEAAANEAEITENNKFAGKESAEISDSLRKDRAYLEKQAEENRKILDKKFAPKLNLPKTVNVKESFVISVDFAPDGCQVWADKSYKMGFLDAIGQYQACLTAAGKRTIDIKCGEEFILSGALDVKEAG
jgi:hypothetical protein